MATNPEKDPEDSSGAHHPKIATELSRNLTLLQITMMGVGMMIGAGVFLGVGNAVRVAGPGGVILTFALNAVIALFTAMSYAELSSAVPRAGGAYNFARIAFGRGTSFLAGWMEWFASSVAGSLYAVTFALYTVHYITQLGIIQVTGFKLVLVEKGVAILIASFFVFINYRGVSETGTMGAIFTLGQTVTLAFIGQKTIISLDFFRIFSGKASMPCAARMLIGTWLTRSSDIFSVCPNPPPWPYYAWVLLVF